MRNIKEKIQISSVDYEELNSDKSRWTKETYAYWVAKFKTNYPTEGYGMYRVYTTKDEDGKCYIGWTHYDSCD